ncbi:MAG: lysoplasmalogenase [Gammaproteobacteria bacterium]|nr:lysoplasmalogenase [Gammaproteobacteria bacterium]
MLVNSQLTQNAVGTIISKLLASTGFVCAALSVGALRTRYGKLVVAALVLSWAGDAFLLGSSEGWFLAGLIGFLLAHCMFLVAFATIGIDRLSFAIASAVTLVLSTIVFLWLKPYVSNEMVWPVGIYTLVISMMVAAAFGAKGSGGTVLIPAGALLFYLSDLSVAAGQFVQPDFPNFVWGLPFYYGGQVLLALSTRTPVSECAAEIRTQPSRNAM